MRIACPYCLEKLVATSRKNLIKKEKGNIQDYFENSQTCVTCGCRWKTKTEVELLHMPSYAKEAIT